MACSTTSPIDLQTSLGPLQRHKGVVQRRSTRSLAAELIDRPLCGVEEAVAEINRPSARRPKASVVDAGSCRSPRAAFHSRQRVQSTLAGHPSFPKPAVRDLQADVPQRRLATTLVGVFQTWNLASGEMQFQGRRLLGDLAGTQAHQDQDIEQRPGACAYECYPRCRARASPATRTQSAVGWVARINITLPL